jgi:hypothetical protein
MDKDQEWIRIQYLKRVLQLFRKIGYNMAYMYIYVKRI